jgi:hypothetical protein
LLECVDAIRHAAARVAQILATEETP